MREKLRTHAGRLFLLVSGILLTSTAGHAGARVIAMQMAQGSSTFAFQLAVLLAAVLLAVPAATFFGRRREVHVADGSASQSTSMESVVPTAPSAAQITQLRLPPGLRLDSHEAIMITAPSADRRILFVNPAFARLTGFEARDWIGRSGDLLLPDGPLRMESLLWLDTEADGTEAHWIARLHRRDGSPFCAEAHLHRMTARAGSSIGHVVMVMTDVTSRVGSGKSRDATKDATGTFETRKLG